MKAIDKIHSDNGATMIIDQNIVNVWYDEEDNVYRIAYHIDGFPAHKTMALPTIEATLDELRRVAPLSRLRARPAED